jgi:hypothetical protein
LLLLAQIGVPGVVAGPGGLRQVLANPVGARQATEIAGTRHGARDKERHGMLRLLLRLALRQYGGGAEQCHADGGQKNFLDIVPPRRCHDSLRRPLGGLMKLS